MTFSKKILTFGSLFLAVGLIGSLLYWDSHFFTVKKMKVNLSSHQRIAKPSPFILEAIVAIEKKMEPYKNKNILRLDLNQLSQEILKDKRILSVQLQRELPMQLSALIEVREIVLNYQDKHGSIFPVTFDGTLLSPVAIEKAPDVPVLRDEHVVKNPEHLKNVLALLMDLPQEGTVSRSTVSEVRWSDPEGLKVELIHEGTGMIVLGEKEIQLRARRAANVIKYLESQKQKWRVIDASFSKKVLVRLRKHS